MSDEQKQESQQISPSQGEDALAACEAKRDEYLAGWQRAKADFLNYKRDEMRRLEEVAHFGSGELVKELLTVLDNFDLAIAALEKSGPVEKGVYLIKSQIEDLLKKRGLARIPVKPGDPFDPAVMEALAVVEAVGPPDTVVEEIEAGYRLYEKVLRPARVRISKEQSAKNGTGTETNQESKP